MASVCKPGARRRNTRAVTKRNLADQTGNGIGLTCIFHLPPEAVDRYQLGADDVVTLDCTTEAASEVVASVELAWLDQVTSRLLAGASRGRTRSPCRGHRPRRGASCREPAGLHRARRHGRRLLRLRQRTRPRHAADGRSGPRRRARHARPDAAQAASAAAAAGENEVLWPLLLTRAPKEIAPVVQLVADHHQAIDDLLVPPQMRAVLGELAPRAYAAHSERVHGTPTPPRSTEVGIGTPHVGVAWR
jgi:hypothetical protein